MRKRGFTLIEMLVALAVFAVVGLISTQLISRVVDHHVLLSERGERLIELQRAMMVMQRDILQLHTRCVRDNFGDARPNLLLDSDGVLEFTRAGWRNPLQQPRSTLQRVAYIYEEESLKRFYWSVLDRVADSQPLQQTLLTDVEAVEFLVVDDQNNTHSFWPLTGAVAPGCFEGNEVAVVARLEVEPYGLIERIWAVP